MYYEEDDRPVRRRRRRRRKRGGVIGWLIKLILKLIMLVLIAAVVLYAIPVSVFMTDDGANVSASSDLPNDKINILLLGVDRLTGSQRSDTIIVASVGYSSLTLTSIMRDTVVNIPGHGSTKVNAAYAYGGPELTLRTLNENFGLNLTKYAVVDFAALADIINALGGVDIEITSAEQAQINKNVADAWIDEFSKQGYEKDDMHLLDLSFAGADEKGRITAHLDGFQALGYARIRKLDSDYVRTSRQRRVIDASLSALKQNWYDVPMLLDLYKAAMSRIQTNMNLFELLSIGAKGIMCTDIQQLRLPADGTFNDNGSSLADINYDKNLAAFKELVYGK